jgi:hypothetical protein
LGRGGGGADQGGQEGEGSEHHGNLPFNMTLATGSLRQVNP